MRILPQDTQCMIVDIQEKLMPAMKGRKEFTDRAGILVRGLRILEIPLLITQHYTKGLGNTIPEIYEAAGTEEFFEKWTFNSGLNGAILSALQENGRKNVLVCGTESHVCVLQTCLGLKELGFNPVLVTDAIASRKKSDKKIALQRAVQEGILLTTTESILFELTVDSHDPRFREISRLVK